MIHEKFQKIYKMIFNRDRFESVKLLSYGLLNGRYIETQIQHFVPTVLPNRCGEGYSRYQNRVQGNDIELVCQKIGENQYA